MTAYRPFLDQDGRPSRCTEQVEFGASPKLRRRRLGTDTKYICCGLVGLGFFFLLSSLLAQLTPVPFLIADTRFSNYTGSVSFIWTPNSEPDLAGYWFYQGVVPHVYTNLIFIEKFANKFTLDNVSRTNRNYFALSAFNFSGVESPKTPELVWPEPPMVVYTDYVAVMESQTSTNLVDWTNFLVVTNYFTPTNSPVFFRTRWKIQRWP